MIPSILLALIATFAKAQEGCGCQGTIIETLDLANWANLFSPFTYHDFVADDGTVEPGTSGLTINSNPFTSFYQPGPVPELDHYKYVLLSNSAYTWQTSEYILEVEFKDATAKVSHTKVKDSPFCRDVATDNDYRFGSGLFSVYSPETGLIFGFLVTNDRVYGYYDRLPFQREQLGNYAAFTYVFPLKHTKCKKTHDLKIGLDQKYETVTYWIDGHRKMRFGNIGMQWHHFFMVGDMGGNQVPTFPQSIQIQFGTYALLDMYPACKDNNDCKFPEERMALVNSADVYAPKRYNPICGPPAPAVYWEPIGISPRMHLWDQGVVLKVGAIIISTRPSCT